MAKQAVFLYVEDDPLSREVMQMLLIDAMGFEQVHLMNDSADFLARIKTLDPQPDVILLDIHIGPYNGFEMLEMLRAQAAYNNTAVIAVTASVMNEEVTRLKASGFNGGIGKPIDQMVFPDLINRILQNEEVWYVT